MKRIGLLEFDEPFAGLFTQGMVCHETYRDAEGNWLLPEQVTKGPDGRLVSTVDGGPVEVGRSEKMSKSKKNVVDPTQIIETYGADTARWFMLSDSPPERDLEWTEAGVEGAWRFTQRLWRLVESRPRGAERGAGGMDRRQWRRRLDAAAPRDPQDHRRGDRGYRALPLQPGGGADL